MANVIALLRQLGETPVNRYNFLRLIFSPHSDIKFDFARILMTDEHKLLQKRIRDMVDSELRYPANTPSSRRPIPRKIILIPSPLFPAHNRIETLVQISTAWTFQS